jgi:hypothetical protein
MLQEIERDPPVCIQGDDLAVDNGAGREPFAGTGNVRELSGKEAANFAIRFNSRIKSFYQKKKSKSHKIVAIKAVAHKLCRACYYIMKDQVPFDITKAFI